MSSPTYPIQRLTPKDAHYFFGYYDLATFSPDSRLHLAHRVLFRDHVPMATDEAEVGYVEVGNPEERQTEPIFHSIAKTTAWNFQQGAMLQFQPGSEGKEILFNQRKGDHFFGTRCDLQGGAMRSLPGPMAAVDPLGRFALGINFSRMFDFRRGYGYAGVVDPFQSQAQPEADGVFRFTLDGSGKSELILSLAELGRIFPPPGGSSAKLIINHMTCNTDGSRFLGLLRNFPQSPEEKHKTLAFSAATDGTDVRMLWDYGVASHYHWKDPYTFAMVIQLPDTSLALVEMDDVTGQYHVLGRNFFLKDGHCSYSPDRRWMLYDSYPRGEERDLMLYDLEKKQGYLLGTLLSERTATDEAIQVRCDFHPRWMPDGSGFSFDSIHEGFRGCYRWDLRSFFEEKASQTTLPF